MELFRGLYLSYRHAPVDIREKVALNDLELQSLLESISQYTQASEAFVLSTCNRTEIYYTAEQDLSDDMFKLLCIVKGVKSDSSLRQYFTSFDQPGDAVKHLFEVALGLDAQILGDLQIINQVKKAYQATADRQLAGPFLHRLLHTIFFANKRVQQETSFRDGAASVSYAVAELVEEHAATFHHPNIMVVGLGEIGTDTVRNLAARGIKNILIANRTHTKAEALHTELPEHTHAISLEEAKLKLPQADIIISCIDREGYFIDQQMIEALPGIFFKVLIDLGMPRSVDPAVEQVPGILLYNIDSIRARVDETLNRRKSAIPAVQTIIQEAIDEFDDWSKEMIVSPTINKLKNALEQIRQEELTRYLKNADAHQAEILDKATKSIIQKVLKLPVLQLKAACRRGEAETMIDVLNDLFNLEQKHDAKA